MIRSLFSRGFILALASAGSIGAAASLSAQTTVAERERSSGNRDMAELFARPVTVNVDAVSLKAAIKAVAASAGVRMQYQTETLESITRPVTLHTDRTPLGTVLSHVLAGTMLRAVVLDRDLIGIKDAKDAAAMARGVISGTVTDGHTRHPVAGAEMVLDDSVARTHTDANGAYRFTNVVAGPHRVTVRSIGFSRQTRLVTVSDDSVAAVNFALASSVNTLDQVVVTATGEQRYRELGHVVTKLNADSLVKNAPITTMAELLTARVPGLQVMTGNGGTAGGEVALRLRGQTTINLDPQPIVILDGVRYKNTNGIASQSTGYGAEVVEDQRPFSATQRSPLNDLNVNDIETIEVVKGPSASTLYGPDAANGVIVITTKHGQSGAPKWNFYVHPNLASITHDGTLPQTGYWAWGHDPNTGEPYSQSCRLILQYEYHQCITDSITVAPTAESDPGLAVIATNRPQWQSGLSVAGGADAFRYFFSGGYDSQVGSLQIPPIYAAIVKDRLGASSLTDVLRNPNTQQTITLRSNLSADLNPKISLNMSVGYTKASQRNIDMSIFQYSSSYGAVRPGCDPLAPDNPCQFSDNSGLFIQSTTLDGDRLDGAFNGVLRPLPWLTVNGTLGLDLDGTIDRGVDPQDGTYVGDAGQVSDYRRNNTGRSGTLNATARAHPGRWSFETTFGTQYSYTHLDGLNAIGYGIAPGSSSISTATQLSTTQLWSETVSLGGYGQEQVGLNDRLFLNGAIRYDGSTSFGDAYHARPFPKIGVSWIASDEPYLRHVPGLDQLRFRYSFGASSRYPTSQMKIGAINSDQQSIEGGTQNFFERSLLANPILRPERTHESEYGVDATILRGKVDVGLTWYRRRTNDQLQMLLDVQGMPGQWANVGDVAAHGSEITVVARLVETEQVRATLNLTSSFNTNKLLTLGAYSPICSGYDCYRVGYPLGAVFDRTITGVADTVGGGPDSVVFEREIVYGPAGYRGILNPTHTYTLTPAVALLGGRLRVSTLLDRATGFIVPDALAYNYGLSLAALVKTAPLLAQARTLTTCCVYDPGDYTRWRELSVSTDLPQRLMRLTFLSRGTVSFQVRNLALWTRYQGGDPESIPGQGTQGQGSVLTNQTGIAQPRTWSISFDLIP